MSSVGGEAPTFEEDPHGSEERRERIRLETPRHRIEGSLMLARDGYRSRVSDMLNASERDFLTLTDVTLQPLEGGLRRAATRSWPWPAPTSFTWSHPEQTGQSPESPSSGLSGRPEAEGRSS